MRVRVFFLTFCFFAGVGRGEIIHFSKLEKENRTFAYKRNLFLPETMTRPSLDPVLPDKGIQAMPEEKQIEKEVKDEVRQAVFFEGYIENNNQFIALVSVDGEFFPVAVGDVIMDKIKVIDISKNRIICEVESQEVEIPIKGDNDD